VFLRAHTNAARHCLTAGTRLLFDHVSALPWGAGLAWPNCRTR
jgi:hypothetical protein